MHEGANPFTAPETLVRGIPFAATLLSILLVHEMGHYIAARRSGVLVTLPYFIPAPTLLGTFGAFIRMRSPVTDRGALVMIGAAGPLAGFLIALPALWIGVATSHLGVIPDVAIQLGDSLIMRAAVAVIHGPIPAGQDLFLNSVGLAAWAGILVTALNLLPIGQLDGGHVAYALFGAKSRWIALGVMLAPSAASRSRAAPSPPASRRGARRAGRIRSVLHSGSVAAQAIAAPAFTPLKRLAIMAAGEVAAGGPRGEEDRLVI